MAVTRPPEVESVAAGPRPGWTRRTFAAMWVRNFRLYFVGQLISNSGNWLTLVALTLLVLHRAGSGFSVGLLAACQFGPMLVLSAWAGVIADRSNKRHLLYVTQSLEMAQSAVLALLAFLPNVPLPVFYVVAAAGGCMLAFDNPARRSFVNEMVQPALVPNAVTLYSANVNLSRLFGPTLAAALVVSVGYGWSFALDSLSYVAMLVALWRMRDAELRPVERTPRGRGQIRAGLRYVLGVPELLISFLIVLVVGTLSYNFSVVLPILVEKALHGSDAQFSLVYAAFSGGAVIGTLLIARRTEVTLRTILVATGVFGASLFGLAAVPSVAWTFPVAAVVGGTSVAYMTATTAHAQLESEPRMIGRVLALQTVLLIGTTPIGGPILGWLADAAGGRAPVVLGAVAALLAAAVGGALAAGRSPLSGPAVRQDG